MKKIRCAIYTRKSAEEGLEQEFNSLDAQREACAAYVASQMASDPWAAGGGRQAHRGCARPAQIGCGASLQATNYAPGRNTYPTAMPDSSSPWKGANC